MTPEADGIEAPGPVHVFNGGFLTKARLRRIMKLAGYPVRLGLPGSDGRIAVWGQSPTAHRGEAVAKRTGAALIRVEDAFLRSLFPGRRGEPPLGLLIDRLGVHFDASAPSDLEQILATDPLDDAALLTRAKVAIARLRSRHLTKYTGFDPLTPVPEPGYVLVIDQTLGDASVAASGGDQALFDEMLVAAQTEHPGARVVVKTHPETMQGLRVGHYDARHASARVTLWDRPCSPWALFEGAVGVYTVSSQLGFEALLADHRPRVFGSPFYAGWGLTTDERALPRRRRKLTRAQLFAGAMILYPKWYDPYRDRLCGIEDALATMEAETRAWREDHRGWVVTGMRLWKRAPLTRVFGQHGKLKVIDDPDRARTEQGDARLMVWASKDTDRLSRAGSVRVEDGFLRSRGLGADLVPPLSLVLDDLGIYYDPARESRLERLIAEAAELDPVALRRAEDLIGSLKTLGLSKYNLAGTAVPDLPEGHCILVPGQVEDDASILTGTGDVRTNLALLESARAAHPDARILYKPHPDVEAGLREGAVPEADLSRLADRVLTNADPVDLISKVDGVWTLTSLLGFEALLRDVPVTCLGTPFYAGWGLTTDLGRVPARRQARPTLAALVHAALITYPRYHDLVTGRPCPVEVVVDRLAHGPMPRPGPANRTLAKLQGLLAPYAALWRS